MKGKKSPSKQYREPGKMSYGKSANVRESTAQSYSKSKSGGKAKEGMYAKYS